MGGGRKKVELRLFGEKSLAGSEPFLTYYCADFSVSHFLKFATSKMKWQISRFIPLCFHAKSFPLARIDSPKIIFQKIISGRKMNPAPSLSKSNTVSSVASSWSESERSEDETPTASDDEFIVSDSEMEEAEQAESEEDDIELLYESFINLREENKLLKEELCKQNNLLWEIYEELKESKPKAPAK